MTPYHRLARETPEYAWWKLPVAGFLAVVGYFFVSGALILVAFLLMYAVGLDGADRITEWFDDAGSINVDRPEFFALDMLGLAVMIPVLLVAVLVTGPRPIGYLTSVTGRMRWSWLGHTSVLAVIVFGGGIGGLVALSYWIDPDSVQSPSPFDGKVLLMLVLVLALTPFQAAAEEYVFRGYLLQLVGSWTRFAWIPVVVSVPIFASGHEYNLWGLVDVGLFGLMAAFLVIRTGGLEAGIAAHAFNNIAILVFEALGMLSDSSGGGPLDLIPTVVMNVLFIALVERSVRRRGIVRTRPPIPAPPPPPMWFPPAPVNAPVFAPAFAPAYQPPPEWVPPPNTPPYPGYLPPGWRPPRH
ncbi:CPBP family intramembrane metalloprotease [Aeromicrobium panaciterrae]|uniref:CPBP family intramembrane glutamic endopeptidase n=1 Tax=Aeromicrobium panaciterrae TaxID=363861 RepID=UPI0031E283D5